MHSRTSRGRISRRATISRFGVMTIPTVVFLKNGQEFDRKVGVMPPQAFSGVLDTNL